MKKLIFLMLAVTAMSNCKAQQKFVRLGTSSTENRKTTAAFVDTCINDTTPLNYRMSSYPIFNPSYGFSYAPGIWYESNNTSDSVGKIIFSGDTMQAVRNLLIYLLQQKSENDAAELVLARINLDQLQKVVFKDDEDFDWDLKNYKKVLAKNKIDLQKRFPEDAKFIR